MLRSASRVHKDTEGDVPRHKQSISHLFKIFSLLLFVLSRRADVALATSPSSPSCPSKRRQQGVWKWKMNFCLCFLGGNKKFFFFFFVVVVLPCASVGILLLLLRSSDLSYTGGRSEERERREEREREREGKNKLPPLPAPPLGCTAAAGREGGGGGGKKGGRERRRNKNRWSSVMAIQSSSQRKQAKKNLSCQKKSIKTRYFPNEKLMRSFFS